MVLALNSAVLLVLISFSSSPLLRFEYDDQYISEVSEDTVRNVQVCHHLETSLSRKFTFLFISGLYVVLSAKDSPTRRIVLSTRGAQDSEIHDSFNGTLK